MRYIKYLHLQNTVDSLSGGNTRSQPLHRTVLYVSVGRAVLRTRALSRRLYLACVCSDAATPDGHARFHPGQLRPLNSNLPPETSNLLLG